MTAVLLSVHVLAAIVLIGPVTAAASLFPRYGREALAARGAAAEAVGDHPCGDRTLGDRTSGSGSEQEAGRGSVAVLRALHRISSGYALIAVAVPVLGVATAARMGVLTQAWLVVSIALTVLAALALGLVIVPRQRLVLARLEHAGVSGEASVDLPALLRRLAMTTGLFALTWAVVVVLMILRPGSTTGV